jgi:hypothetical protein
MEGKLMSVTAFIKNRWPLSIQKPLMELCKCNLNSIDLGWSGVHKLDKRAFINTYILNYLPVIFKVSEGMKILFRIALFTSTVSKEMSASFVSREKLHILYFNRDLCLWNPKAVLMSSVPKREAHIGWWSQLGFDWSNP